MNLSKISLALCLCTIFSFVSSANPEAMSDLVTDLLPGQPEVSFKHYAGYVTVNETNGRALYYWFFEAVAQPNVKPLVLWLNGGPGSSSVGFGETQEIGPFLVDNKGNSIKLNPYSWNTEANLLFLETPAGVGFSYSNTSSDYIGLSIDSTAGDTYVFLQKWFERFPAFKGNEFFMAGESYAGYYVPTLAQIIYDKNKEDNDNLSFHINLKGFMLGNPSTSYPEDMTGKMDYAWSHAVISEETYRVIKEHCDFSNDRYRTVQCNNAVDEVFDQYLHFDPYNFYPSKCLDTTLDLGDGILDAYTTTFYNRADVQKALHASDGVHLKTWNISNRQIFGTWADMFPSALPIYKKLINDGGLRIWLYSGDTDGAVPVLGTRYCITKLELPIKTAWRRWYHEKQVSGWVQEYHGLTFATVKGAGHAVPTFKPSESLALFSAFLKGTLPPLSP